MSEPTSRWNLERTDGRGADYDLKWEVMAAAGASVHGEADFVSRFEPRSVLDAGCGTGRVAIELARRGVDVVGVDLDATMLDQAKTKAPRLTWVRADICDAALGRSFDLVLTAGNVMVFVAPGREADVVRNLAAHLAPGGLLVSGFQLDGPYGLARYDADCATAGLELVARHATWDGAAPAADHDYAVSVHRAIAGPPPRTSTP